jgi:hypothetical protein
MVTIESHPFTDESVTDCVPEARNCNPFHVKGSWSAQILESIVTLKIGFTKR